MRFLALILFFIAICLSNCQADDKEDLINYAKKQGTPFRQESQLKIKGPVWGAARADYSIDVIIYNRNKKDFILDRSTCSSGAYSSGLTPAMTLSSAMGSVFGMQSMNANGVTCDTKYKTQDGKTWFLIRPQNPDKTGKVGVLTGTSFDLSVKLIVHGGNHARVTLTVKDSRSPFSLGRTTGEQGTSSSRHRRLNPAQQNMIVKASRSRYSFM